MNIFWLEKKLKMLTNILKKKLHDFFKILKTGRCTKIINRFITNLHGLIRIMHTFRYGHNHEGSIVVFVDGTIGFCHSVSDQTFVTRFVSSDSLCTTSEGLLFRQQHDGFIFLQFYKIRSLGRNGLRWRTIIIITIIIIIITYRDLNSCTAHTHTHALYAVGCANIILSVGGFAVTRLDTYLEQVRNFFPSPVFFV